jgi:antitoxin component of MazEF toxin-antitoxin module
MQVRRVVKQGGSLLVVLPKRYCNALGVRVGDYLQFDFRGRSMEVKRVSQEVGNVGK